jgi:hypothetical protein
MARRVDITIHQAALESIFDECDRYDDDETGGRLVGEYSVGWRKKLAINVSGLIGPGPKAKRNATYLMQDGDYQERVFRELEAQHPKIEHLGNWHTHHMNGYPTLSSGDRKTYHRIVNHEKHNTDFFYALLVTTKNAGGTGLERYNIKHFVVFRDDPREHEVPSSHVQIVDRPLLGTGSHRVAAPEAAVASSPLAEQRVRDSDFFGRLQPDLRPFRSKDSGGVYWRGPITLVDNSRAQVVVAEVEEKGEASYAVSFKTDRALTDLDAEAFASKRFHSAREAVVVLERELNRAIYRARSER